MSNFPTIGEIFDDKYEIEEILGSGGNGTVFKALQLDCQRIVALKVLHRETAMDEEYRARFLREAQALSKLSHANIVTVYHLGVSSSNLPYLVMEYITGKSVRAIANSLKSFPVLRALRIIRDTARAMSYIHAHEIIHRDLKPENILITQEPEDDTVKLVDFGLAKLTIQQEQNLTSTGELLGTSKYMSPEQCLGKAVDFRSDIYSLSVCLYEMLTGLAPFEADNSIGLLYKHINEAVPTINPKKANPHHARLDSIISCGIAKDPQQRFASMEEMANKIDETMSVLTAGIRPKFFERRQIIFTLILICATVICSIFFIQAFHNHFLSNNKSKSLARPNTIKEASEQSYHRALAKLKTLEKFKDPNHHDLALRLFDVAEELIQQNRTIEAEPLLERAIALLDKTGSSSEDRAVLLESIGLLARCFRSQNDFVQAERLSKRALLISQETRADVYITMSNLAECYLNQNKYAEAEALTDRFLIDAKKQFGQNDPAIAPFLNESATCYKQAGKLLEAERLLKQSIALVSDVEKEAAPAVGASGQIVTNTKMLGILAESLSMLAELYAAERKYPEALALLKRTLVIRQKTLKSNDPTLILTSVGLAECYRGEGNLQEAERIFKQALLKWEKGIGPDDLAINEIRECLGDCYISDHKHSEAVSIIKQALVSREKIPGPNNNAERGDDLVLARCYALWDGHEAEAEPWLKRAVTMPQNSPGITKKDAEISRSQLLIARSVLALSYQKQNRFVEAEEQYKSMLDILEKSFNAGDPDIRIGISNLLKQDKSLEAQSLLQRAAAIKKNSASK